MISMEGVFGRESTSSFDVFLALNSKRSSITPPSLGLKEKFTTLGAYAGVMRVASELFVCFYA